MTETLRFRPTLVDRLFPSIDTLYDGGLLTLAQKEALELISDQGCMMYISEIAAYMERWPEQLLTSCSRL